jgi:succinate dehydrogenase / fumarate reductase cytochrome b subunit
MAKKSGFINTTIARKVAMALSALFLMVFLVQHFTINFTSVLSPETFNELSHFMGTNPVVQIFLQPVLMFGVVFHFVMGFILTIRNRKARPIKYAQFNGAANSSWTSRNMIFSGLFLLFFLGFHFNDFWIPEMVHKYVESNPEDANRYYPELLHMFENPWRIGVYVLSFVFLSLHLLHGFQSSFQSMGWRHPKYTPIVEKLGKFYAIFIPAGFVFIALFHYINHL